MIWLGILIAIILFAGFAWCWTDYNPEGLDVWDWIAATFRAIGAVIATFIIVGLADFMWFCFTGHLL